MSTEVHGAQQTGSPTPGSTLAAQKSQLGKQGLWSGPQAPEALGAAKAQPPAHLPGTGAGRARVASGRSQRARRECFKARVKGPEADKSQAGVVHGRD